MASSASSATKTALLSLREFVRGSPLGVLRRFLDGNLAIAHSRRSEASKVLCGVDKFGNKYYEAKEEQDIPHYGRKRWVEYADEVNYEATTVPVEWHPWMHHIHERPPTALSEEEVQEAPLPLHPKYEIPFQPNQTFTERRYLTKGQFINRGARPGGTDKWSKSKVELWNPGTAASGASL